MESAQTPPDVRTAAARKTIARWLDLQAASLNLRYRYADNSASVVTNNLLQHREALRGRVKFDAPGRFGLDFGLYTGTRFTSGWDSTGVGNVDAQRNLAFKQLFLSAEPVKGVQAQYGSLYLVRGQSTELTTYDEDGYITGERVSIKRPHELFFDEISATYAYLGDIDRMAVSKRWTRLDEPNYRHLLLAKQVSKRVAVSGDYTSAVGSHTWRQGVALRVPEARALDSVVVEAYERTNNSPDHGFAVSLLKAVHRSVTLGGGYADIDPRYGNLNSDRFNIGKRLFASASWQLSPEFTPSIFLTTAVGDNPALPQRTLLNVVFAYNVLSTLKRTKLF